MTDRELRIAQIVCTQKQLDVCILTTAGRTQREIATALGISRRSVRDRLADAQLKIGRHITSPSTLNQKEAA
jgi:DNA-binding CsgD family transcriptional regulator